MMKKRKAFLFFLAMVLIMAGQIGLAAITTDRIDGESSGTNTLDVWAASSTSGTLYLQTTFSGSGLRTGFDVLAHPSTLPSGSTPRTQIYVYGTQSETNFERLSIAMQGSEYRLGVESGGSGTSLNDLNFNLNGHELLKLDTTGIIYLGRVSDGTTGVNRRNRHILSIEQGPVSSAGQYDSHWMSWTSKSRDGGVVYPENWRAGVDITSNSGDSKFVIQHTNNTKFTMTDSGDVETGGSIDIYEFLALGDAETVTPSGSTITISKSFHIVNCTSNQTINTINGGTAGDIVVFMKSGSGNCTFPDVAGNVDTFIGFTLDSSNDSITLFYTGSTWVELKRADN